MRDQNPTKGAYTYIYTYIHTHSEMVVKISLNTFSFCKPITSGISKPVVCKTSGLQLGGLHENNRNQKTQTATNKSVECWLNGNMETSEWRKPRESDHRYKIAWHNWKYLSVMQWQSTMWQGQQRHDRIPLETKLLHIISRKKKKL